MLHVLSLSPCGESGLKYHPERFPDSTGGLSPCGESGLKFNCNPEDPHHYMSLPMRGEWIEIRRYSRRIRWISVSPHAGRVD